MKPTEVFPSLTFIDDKITISRQDLHLPENFTGANLAYSFVQQIYDTQALPVQKSNPLGIARDTIRQNYRIEVKLLLNYGQDNLVGEGNGQIPEPPKPPEPIGGQQLTNVLHLTNELQLKN